MPKPNNGVVLVTRPEPGASDTASRLLAAGYFPVVAPVMTIVPRTPILPSRVQALLVTSANALGGLPAALHAIPLLAVGDATAARAREAGVTTVHSAGRDGAELAALAGRLCDAAGAPLLLLTGAGQGCSLAADLRARGFRVHRRVAYITRPAAALAHAALGVLRVGSLGQALFFSPETARHFVRLFRRAAPEHAVAGWQALAISQPAAAALAPLPWACIRVASAPNQDALLALLR